MATRTPRRGQPEPDPAAVLARLRSPDPRARIKALHSICPCDAGFPLYERFRTEVKRLQKDPDPAVRAAALHVERDAYEIEIIEAGLDRADEQGWRYSDNDWVTKFRQRHPPARPVAPSQQHRVLSQHPGASADPVNVCGQRTSSTLLGSGEGGGKAVEG